MWQSVTFVASGLDAPLKPRTQYTGIACHDYPVKATGGLNVSLNFNGKLILTIARSQIISVQD